MSPLKKLVLFLIVAALVIVVLLAIHSMLAGAKSPGTSLGPSPSVVTSAGGTVAEDPGAKCHLHGLLPDPVCTPGEINPDVTQANLNQTICVSGFTKTIRPPASLTNKIKAQQMGEYGFTDSLRNHEEDHLISLELGGAPSDPRNLWPEPGFSPNPKDKVENFLHAAVCAGRVTLAKAQQLIATDWTTAEQGL